MQFVPILVILLILVVAIFGDYPEPPTHDDLF